MSVAYTQRNCQSSPRAWRGRAGRGTVHVMEAREEPHDPGYDDWFDEPEPLTESQSAANRGVYEDAEEVWMLPEEGSRASGGQREIVIGGRAFTMTQVAIVGISLLAIFFAILAAAGVFNGKAATQPVAPTVKLVTVTEQATTAAITPPTTEAPAQTLKPGDTGSQVIVLQKALKKLGFSPGTPDGDYGPSTQIAVERFQASKGLDSDGVVGPQTLNALQKALAG